MIKDLPYSGLGRTWLFRYKLYQLPLWFCYHYLWWTLSLGDPLKAAAGIFSQQYIIKFSFYWLLEAAAVWFNFYFLMPRFLDKSRWIPYMCYLSLTILATAALIVPGYFLNSWVVGSTPVQLYGPGANSYFHLFLVNALPSAITSMTLAMTVKLTYNFLGTQRRQQLLEQERLESELNYLRYQFNPHFLFNTINSIFFLIHKNPDMASASLAKFSELLRYQLYDCNDKWIALSREFAYLENFIQLEKLRQNENVQVEVEMPPTGGRQAEIAPFVLMTFVENAFKHVSRHAEQPNRIRIVLRLEGSRLYFSVTNSVADNATRDIVHYGGIGLNNVRRRLDLLYPGRHELLIDRDAEQFSVRLWMDLENVGLRVKPSPAAKVPDLKIPGYA